LPDLDLVALAAHALGDVSDRLSALLGRSLRAGPPSVALVPLAEAVRAFGSEEAPAVAVVVSFTGDLVGQILLLWTEASAGRLVRWCLPPGAGAALEESVVAEVGNVAGSAFVSSVADRFAWGIQLAPPVVVADMAGAVLGSVLPLAEAAPGSVLLVRTEFSAAEEQVRGLFLLAPDGPSLARLLARLAPGGPVRGR
jgi:chemotaxis protein CheC